MLRSSFLLLLLIIIGKANGQQEYAGSWEGKLDMAGGLRIVFHINDQGGRLSASADSPDQGAKGIKCNTVYVNSSGIHIEMHAVRAAYAGKLSGDSIIDGTFTQGGPMPLRLHKSGTAAQAPRRPQEPVPPFPYKSEEIIYTGKNTRLQYGATLTLPPGKGPFPAALLITGSGPQNRDEELMGHRPFAVLADALTRNGVAVLRVDDRGIGKSSGDFKNSTTEDFAADVSEGMDYLLARTEIKKDAVGLIGHSEGGMIAPIVTSKRNDAAFVILLAAPGIPIISLMTEQSGAILRSSGVPDTAVRVYAPFYSTLMKTLTSGTDSALALKQARTYMQNWAAVTDTAILRMLQLNSPIARMQMFMTMAGVARSPWFRYFMAYDPAPFLEKMKMKVLALNGERDIQVLAASNIEGIRKAFERNGNKKATVHILPGLNHLFQRCSDCTVAEYATLEETFSPVALKEINDWINSNVK